MDDARVISAGNLEILVGTYEEFVLGYKLTENAEGVSFTLPQNFKDVVIIIIALSRRELRWCPASPTTATAGVFVQYPLPIVSSLQEVLMNQSGSLALEIEVNMDSCSSTMVI